MATYILIAGAWHGSWCWSNVKRLLEDAGQTVLTPDLTGTAPGEPLPIDDPISAWANQIARLVEAQPDPVILVGHSRAGIVISQVAERLPGNIAMLVYLSAYLLDNGKTINDVAITASNAAAFAAAVTFNPTGTCIVREDEAQLLFYNACPPTIAEAAVARLVPEPIAAFMTPVTVSEDRFGSVPRIYIECLQDQAIPVAHQRAMQRATGTHRIDRLDSDHSPFLSEPIALTQLLLAARD